jgi:predicted ribosome quality control (RQC) complex YloA/Tae2 family protein
MGKGKLTLLDVRAIVKELRTKLVGLRCANIYHLNAKTFLLKLSGTDIKHTLLVESGARIHTTKYEREHDKMPSNFCTKLRKHLRLQKLEDIQQVGNDRIIQFTFGRGEKGSNDGQRQTFNSMHHSNRNMSLICSTAMCFPVYRQLII